MHDKPKGDGADERASTATQDLRDQSVVLMVVLANHPAQLAAPRFHRRGRQRASRLP